MNYTWFSLLGTSPLRCCNISVITYIVKFNRVTLMILSTS